MKPIAKIGTGAIIGAGFAGLNALRRKACYPIPPAFYDPPLLTGTGEPGEIVRVEKIPWVLRTPGWRVLYRSTDHRGKPSIVSGLLVAPAGSPPTGGWPVVAVAHGTAGLPRGAAPSMTLHANSDETAFVYASNIRPFVDAGYAVAYTDYQGLGAPGGHSYLVGATEAANVLDSIRAIRRFSEIPVSDRVFVWGHSQGGHAAAFAVQHAPRYAPELTFAGAVLLAPAAELRQITDHVLDRKDRCYLPMLVMLTIASWGEAYPELNADDVLTPLGRLLAGPTTERLRMSYGALFCWPFTTGQLFHADALDTWTRYLDENTPGHEPLGVPVLIQQGDADDIIPPATNYAFANRLRASGEDVTLETYPDRNHLDVLDPALPAAIAWMARI